MEKIVVFGGSGFIGSHVADLLSDEGYDVHLFDRTQSKYLRTDQTMIVGDVLDKELVGRAVEGARYVYHFAGIADIGDAYNKPIAAIETNILSTTYILDACVKYKVQKFMFASTIYVYSNHGSFYRATKQACELIIECYAKEFNLSFSIMRYGSLYGKRATINNSIKKMISQAIQSNKITREGDGSEVRDYINVKDAALASFKLLFEGPESKYVMITGNQTYKISEILKMIKEMFSNEIEIEYTSTGLKEHYQVTPYNFKPNVAKKYTLDFNHDFGQGVLEAMYDTFQDLNKKAQ